MDTSHVFFPFHVDRPVERAITTNVVVTFSSQLQQIPGGAPSFGFVPIFP
jgi:hypothetical protein